MRQAHSELSSVDFQRNTSFKERQKAQQLKLNLPLLPTTTIGSFPQTKEVRKNRAALKRGGNLLKNTKSS